MPFEILEKESHKETIDCEIADQLLDIWEASDHLLDCIERAMENDDLPDDICEKLYVIEQYYHPSYINITNIADEWIDRKGIKSVIQKERKVP